MKQPVAYIRRSAKSSNDPGDVSREFQIDKVRSLAGADADRLVIIDRDWGRSASTDKTNTRLAFLELIAQIERGEVSAVYAYATDRLARSVEWAARFLNACRRAGVPVITSEGRFEPDNHMTDQLFYFQAMQNEGFSRQASQKRKATVAVQKARGDVIGQKPYGANPGEDPAAVVRAFKEAGTYHGAVRLLTEWGTPSRRGHLKNTREGVEHGAMQGWSASTVRRILLREAPDLVPQNTSSGARTVSTHIFSRLLVCPHDGSTLTTLPRKLAGGRTSVSYACRVGHRAPAGTHPRPWVITESRILPWAKKEAAKVQSLDITWDEQSREAQAEAIAALDAKRMRWLELYAEGDIDKAERDRRLAGIEEERGRLETVRRVKAFTLQAGIDWDGPPGEVNAKLRNLWRAIILGPDMTPVRAEWIVTPDELAAREAALDEELQK